MNLPRPFLRPTLVTLCLALAAGAAEPVAELAGRIQAHLQAERFQGARWAVKVVSLDSGRTLFEQDAHKLMVPASTTKLFTAALALRAGGPGQRIRTSLCAAAPPVAGVLAGDLVLVGRGDPYVLAPGTAAEDPLESLAGQLKAAGVRRIAGDLIGDDSLFNTPPYGSGWEAGDLQWAYGAEPSALSIHGNTVELRVYPGSAADRPCFVFPQPGLGLLPLVNRSITSATLPAGIRASRGLGESAIQITGSLPPGAAPVRLSVPVHDPALLFAQLLRRALERNGIQVLGRATARHTPGPPAPMELAHLESPTLAEIVTRTLKHSDNLGAQLLLLQVGAQQAAGDTEQRGLEALGRFLAGNAVAAGEVLFEEGSGMSRKNLTTAAALVDLLRTMDRSPEAAVFRAALPVAGVDGTLARRMLGSAAQGNLRAKTGTMRYNQSLAGYVTSAAGERLAFALILNNYRADPALAARSELDPIAVLLAEYPGRP